MPPSKSLIESDCSEEGDKEWICDDENTILGENCSNKSVGCGQNIEYCNQFLPQSKKWLMSGLFTVIWLLDPYYPLTDLTSTEGSFTNAHWLRDLHLSVAAFWWTFEADKHVSSPTWSLRHRLKLSQLYLVKSVKKLVWKQIQLYSRKIH